MRNILPHIVLFILALLSGAISGCDAAPPFSEAQRDLECLTQAYPNLISGMEEDGGNQYLVLASGERILYDDGTRGGDEKDILKNPTMRQAMEQPYPLGPVSREAPSPQKDFHPGRRRVQAFFKAAYGHNAGEVGRNLTAVPFPGQALRFNSKHDAAKALAKVGVSLTALLDERPELASRILPALAGLNWRPVAGTDRLSLHAFALAVDLAPNRNPYWRWNPGRKDVRELVAAFPAEVIAAFEKNGFIWGGKWAEYDLMHFEYRPELICKARRLSASE